jgi:NitT/TauT family transport system substrate-binding protein
MEAAMPNEQSRRRFLNQLGVAGVAAAGGLGTVGLVGGARSVAAEPTPEITTIRIQKISSICTAPHYAAEALLRAEGFVDVGYEPNIGTPTHAVASNQMDWATDFASNFIAEVDSGAAVTVVAGIHAGCYNLLAHDPVHSIADLKGRTVGWDPPDYLPTKHLVALMAKFVGLDPITDIHWLDDPKANPMALFINGKIDGFLAVPPQIQELRARGIGHLLVNSATDRPWSQYFCCMLVGRTEFVQRYPVATKRIVRAFLKGTDLCANAPELVARLMVERGFTDRYDYALETLQELPYDVWREFDPEDTVRFYTLRMNEAGFSKSTPQQIIANHTNWRFFNEVKRELKA